jgi:cell division protein FtsB
MRIVSLILFVLLILLQFKLWFGDGGYAEVKRLEERVEQQKVTNAELQAEVIDLREKLDAVEERARKELGLIKPAEEFYQVVPPPPKDQIPDNDQRDGT